eukprot:Blabericola_migrator_1__5127@NODE_264_length_10634_cov_183_258446_g220_i0_p2_GENE_NODE_264_length_10634_cov_183_258446_g220_i0NODE_264_length_10634_cov_183_258446_g220_i0_p2_ORF_typecomplete_len512_score102_26PPV_E1_C/PF00519_17/0_078Dynamin_N/PF00350_23/0_24TniB/PF05621_11/1_4TniB/PF05621_11/2_5e02MMR_HSR1/PF01926_23/0_47_NODE_264_length_10634_cov_183_258446_g220_i079479482
MWNLNVVSNQYGLSQVQQFKHPDMHDEDILEVDPSDDPFASVEHKGNSLWSFVLTGDQNAGKSTFLHSCIDANSPGFTSFASLMPLMSGYFCNTRLSNQLAFQSEAERIAWSRDHGRYFDTDIGRGTLIMSRANFDFLLIELGIKPHQDTADFAALSVTEYGGDFLDRILRDQNIKGQLDVTHFNVIHNATVKSLAMSQANGLVYFVNMRKTSLFDKLNTLKSHFYKDQPVSITFVCTQGEDTGDVWRPTQAPWSNAFDQWTQVMEEEGVEGVESLFKMSEDFVHLRVELGSFMKSNWSSATYEIIPVNFIHKDSTVNPYGVYFVWVVLLLCHQPSPSTNVCELACWIFTKLMKLRQEGHQYVPLAALYHMAQETADDDTVPNQYFPDTPHIQPIAQLFNSTCIEAFELLSRTLKLVQIGGMVPFEASWVFVPTHTVISHGPHRLPDTGQDWLLRMPRDNELWEAFELAFKKCMLSDFEELRNIRRLIETSSYRRTAHTHEEALDLLLMEL